jgi:hypothetical protein
MCKFCFWRELFSVAKGLEGGASWMWSIEGDRFLSLVWPKKSLWLPSRLRLYALGPNVHCWFIPPTGDWTLHQTAIGTRTSGNPTVVLNTKSLDKSLTTWKVSQLGSWVDGSLNRTWNAREKEFWFFAVHLERWQRRVNSREKRDEKWRFYKGQISRARVHWLTHWYRTC